MTFTATERPRRRSMQRYTVDIPPRAMGVSIRYLSSKTSPTLKFTMATSMNQRARKVVVTTPARVVHFTDGVPRR